MQKILSPLDDAQALLAAIILSAEDAIVGKTLDGIIRVWSPGAVRLFGYDADEIIGRPGTLLLPPERQNEERLILERIELGERVESYESQRLRKDGTRVDVSLTISPIRSLDGRIVGASKIARDITSRITAERRERRLADFYAALSQTNAAIVRIRDEIPLFDEICRVCVELGHVSAAFVALARDGYAQPVSAAGADAGYATDLRIPLSPSAPEGRGPVGIAMREGRRYVTNDLLSDPASEPWRERSRALNIKAGAVMPFRRGGEVEGCIALYAPETDFFDAQVLQLLEEIASDLSFALDNLDRDAARVRAENELRRSQARLLSAQASAQLGSWEHDLRSGQMHWTEQMFRLFECDPAEGTPAHADLFAMINPEDSARFSAAYEEVASRGLPAALEFRSHPLRGPKRWFTASLEGARGEDGTVTVVSGTVQDITERKRHELRIEHMGTHDALTDLPNVTLMRDRVSQAIMRARRVGWQAAVIFVDLDRFKLINDGYGHLFGNALLLAAAARLRGVLRDCDTVGRLGGDEFLLLLTDLSRKSSAYVIAQKVLDSFRAPFVIDNREIFCTASIGVSLYPEDGTDVDTLIGNADIAMFRSKELGRNTYHFFTAEMSEETRHRVRLEAELRLALTRNELHLVYQPKVDLRDGSITGCEALLRWQHPVLGAISPAQFIPIAEETGLIIGIGDWVLRTACRQSRAWQDAGLRPIVVSVNMSTMQFRQRNLARWVREVLQETGLAAQNLELELTETIIADDTDHVVGVINSLKALGLKLSIDDFGTGFSSLSYLRRFRFDTLKIDQSFIRNLTSQPDDAAIAMAVIALAHNLRMSAVAEGVETAEHARILRANGCEAMQGYYFSRPVLPDEIADMLRSGKRLELD